MFKNNNIKSEIITGILFLFGLYSFNLISEEHSFKENVNSFIKKYDSRFLIDSSKSNFTGVIDKENNYSWNRKITLKNDQITIELFIYEYLNASECKLALDSLLDCFPIGCIKTTKGKEIKALKTTPSIFIVNKNKIIVSKIGCNQESKFWNEFKESLISNFTNNESKIIVTECGGPLKWQ